VGPRTGLDRCGKSRPPPGFDPRTVQPVASRYTDYATRPTPISSRVVQNIGLQIKEETNEMLHTEHSLDT